MVLLPSMLVLRIRWMCLKLVSASSMINDIDVVYIKLKYYCWLIHINPIIFLFINSLTPVIDLLIIFSKKFNDNIAKLKERR